eukprot:jgi/Ulvmu1/9070/UM005_0165.1
MSSTTGDIDAKRRSLYDVISAQVTTSFDDVLARVTYVAKLTSSCSSVGATKLFDTHGELVNKACSTMDDTSEQVTGFVLVFPSCAAVQLEAKQHTLDAILGEINNNLTELSFAQVRIISSTDDIPSRAYTAMSTAFQATDSKAPAEELEVEAAVAEASNINLKFIAFGQEMKSLKGPELQTALDHISTYWEGMPRADKVLCLLEFNDAPTISAYLDMFTAPLSLDLDSERVWPIPRLPALKGC